MTTFSLKAKFQGRGANFRDVEGKIKRGFDKAIEAFLKDRQKEIIDNYLEHKGNTARNAHPLTRAVPYYGKNVNRIPAHIDIMERLEVKKVSDDEWRLGFFEQDPQIMAIIYLQEFGANIFITDKMRNWYNAMARENNFPPLNPNTRVIVTKAGMFMRKAFFGKEFASAKVLANRLRFAVKRTFNELKEGSSTTHIGRFEDPEYSGERPPSG